LCAMADVPAWVIGCHKLRASDWRVYLCIALHADPNPPSMADIASRTRVRRQDVPRSLRRLERVGALRRQNQRAGAGWGRNSYVVVLDKPAVSADLRTGGVREDADRVSVGLRTGCPQIDTPSVRKSADPIEEEKEETHSAHARARVDGDANGGWFDEFWRVYPHRGSHADPKKPAQLKFEALLRRGIDPADIVRGAEHYRATIERDGTEPRYVAQAITWLNQERFVDHQQQPPARQPLRAGMA
jgi:predicted transcriptional regulator